MSEIEKLQAEITQLKASNEKLHDERAEIEGDIRVVVDVFGKLLGELEIDFSDFKSGNADIMSKLPGMLSKITMKLMSGNLDTSNLSNITALTPILQKYKSLVDDIIPM